MKALNQLKTFMRILDEYPAETPLGKFLPGFYRQNKQMGSNDRKVAGRLVYNYFRLGKALADLPTDERLKQYTKGVDDKNLEVLYFQYGRYLLISSSRTEGVPANLQGIWNPYIRPPWS
jgi:hypothetical protein